MALKAKSLATATTTTATTSGCPTNRPIATTFHLELTSQQSAAHADSQWSYGFVVCVSRACDLEHRHMCQKCRYAVVLFLDVSFAHSSARLGSPRLGLAWLGDSYCGVSRLAFFLIRKKRQTSLAWRCDVFFFLLFLYCCSHSFVVCLLTSQTHVSAAQGFLWVSLPQRYLHSSIGTAIEIDLLLFSLHICVSFCLLFCVISFILHFVFHLPKMHLQFAHAAYT